MVAFKAKNDTKLRKLWWVEDAMRHPAKGHIAFWQEIIDRYTVPGDTILDPMAGIGTTMVGALMGRNVICNEMEAHFVEPMVASWEKMQQNPMLGYEIGQVRIMQGDARCLTGEMVDSVITSPPYQEIASTARHVGGLDHGAFSYTRPDAIVTSPPYEEHHQGGIDKHPERAWPDGKSHGTTIDRYSGADAVVTSPPYEGTDVTLSLNSATQGQATTGNLQRRYTRPDTGAGENIGNQKGDAYWESMRQVYASCHDILKPGGVMALVLKGFTRDGKYQDLPEQTKELCETLGFQCFDIWHRELWSLSFWRILQQRRDPQAFDDRLKNEYVYAFRKG